MDQLAAVLSDDEIDAALSAFAASVAMPRESPTRRLKLAAAARATQGESRVAALEAVFLTQEGQPRAAALQQGDRKRRAVDLRTCSTVRKPSSPRSMTSWRICAWPKRAPRCWRSPTRYRPIMSGASGRKPRSTMTTSSSRRRTCCRAPMRPPGCSTRSTAASITSWSTRRRTPTPRNGASSRLWRRSSLPARAQASKLRTLFAVGDEKQSIYSFQGANPARFGEVGRAFRQRAEALGLVWHEVPLNLSFRSTEPILEAVDSVFGTGACRRRADLAGGRDHPARPLQERRSGSGRAVGGRDRGEVRAETARLRALERGAGGRALGRSALQAHRRRDQRLARQRRAACLRKAARSRPAIF